MNLIEQQEREFRSRHIGPTPQEEKDMLQVSNEKSLEELVNKTIPSNIKNEKTV